MCKIAKFQLHQHHQQQVYHHIGRYGIHAVIIIIIIEKKQTNLKIKSKNKTKKETTNKQIKQIK